MINDNFQKLKRLISEDKILLLPHKKYKGIRQILVYARCGISKKYFEKTYNNGDVILQIGELGPRIGYPIPWEKVFEEELNGKEGENNQNKDETIQNFKNTIKEHEDQLFGIQLFMENIKQIYGHDKTTMEYSTYAFQNIIERGNTAISQAKLFLDKVKSGTASSDVLESFQFPPIHGPGLDEMTLRATLLVEAYEKLFPNRPRNLPLDKEEHTRLMQEAINNF